MGNKEELIELGVPVKDQTARIIKVVGVGGGGSNAVKNMYEQGLHNISFAICNTDSQALASARIPVRIQLGSKGLGVGGDPAKGREEAEHSIEEIKKLFQDDTRMVFITAGMGGGTGTGAAPIIASIAREFGILTVGVVTLPFAFEKQQRINKALAGIEKLRRDVDSLLVINNERLMEIYSDGITTAQAAFSEADNVLAVATKTIAEIITVEGEINRDFCDVNTVMANGGGAIVSVGRASGEHRILKAVANALNSPLLSNIEIEKARKLLYIIYTCKDNPVLISELNEVNSFMDTLSPDLEVFWGLYNDDTLGDDVKISITATGFDKDSARPDREDGGSEETIHELYDFYYGKKKPKATCAQESQARQEAEATPETGTGAEAPDGSAGKPEVPKPTAAPPRQTWLQSICARLREMSAFVEE